MKKIFLSFAVLAASLFTSCNDKIDTALPSTPDSVAGSVVNVSFTSEDAETRTFFASTATAETWEKSLSSLVMYVFDSAGDIITLRKFSSTELTAATATFAIPGVESGDQCKFYVVANDSTIGYVEDESTLLAKVESSAAVYNGTFAEVNSAAKRSGGFLMSGSSTKSIATGVTEVEVTLKRTVAKVAVQVAKSSTFTSLYSGDLKINSITVSKAASQSRVFAQSTPSTGSMVYSHSQTSNVSGSYFQNLFYLFENGALAEASRVTLTINATYDVDGNFTTTTDQASMTYTLTLDGTSGGAITRNGYYRVTVNINGLSGADATLEVSVADWETVATQTVNLGA